MPLFGIVTGVSKLSLIHIEYIPMFTCLSDLVHSEILKKYRILQGV